MTGAQIQASSCRVGAPIFKTPWNRKTRRVSIPHFFVPHFRHYSCHSSLFFFWSLWNRTIGSSAADEVYQSPSSAKVTNILWKRAGKKPSAHWVESFNSRCQPNEEQNGLKMVLFTLTSWRHLLNRIWTSVFERFEPGTKNSEADVLHTWQLNRRNFAKKSHDSIFQLNL